MEVYVLYVTHHKIPKGVARRHQSNKIDNTMDRRKRSKDKQWFTKHYTEN